VKPRHTLPPASPPSNRRAWFGPEFGALATPVIGRGALSQTPAAGPFIIEEYEGTTVVPPDCTAALDTDHNIIIRWQGGA
jgi:N-methylhydantoinase A